MHRPARSHSVYRYEYHRGNEVGVIADDVTGANPFGAPPDGIFVAPFEQGEIGPDLFRKRVSSGLRAWAGWSRHWVK